MDNTVEQHADTGAQLALFDSPGPDQEAGRTIPLHPRTHRALCAGCRSREARYGFGARSGARRAGTLCFQCFRMELIRRQDVADRRARGWEATQAALPMADRLEELSLRRRRAQIAARHALELT